MQTKVGDTNVLMNAKTAINVRFMLLYSMCCTHFKYHRGCQMPQGQEKIGYQMPVGQEFFLCKMPRGVPGGMVREGIEQDVCGNDDDVIMMMMMMVMTVCPKNFKNMMEYWFVACFQQRFLDLGPDYNQFSSPA